MNFKDTLIDIVDYIINRCNLSEENFDEVQEIIFNNDLKLDKHEILTFFHSQIICPQCSSIKGSKCQCFSREHL